MKALTKMLLVALLVVGLTNVAVAGTTDDKAITITVGTIAEISSTGTPTLTIDATTATGFAAGDSLFTVTDADSCTYGVTNNSPTSKKITAHLDAAITETLVKLYITLASASGVGGTETEITSVVIAAPASVVTGLAQEADSAQVITYKATAEVTSPIGAINKTVTLTLIDEA